MMERELDYSNDSTERTSSALVPVHDIEGLNVEHENFKRPYQSHILGAFGRKFRLSSGRPYAAPQMRGSKRYSLAR